MDQEGVHFEWDLAKEIANVIKLGVSFKTAQRAFDDPCRTIVKDKDHSMAEDRFYCLGKVDHEVLTVRFTLRGYNVRITGAGYWRKGRKTYEEANRIH